MQYSASKHGVVRAIALLGWRRCSEIQLIAPKPCALLWPCSSFWACWQHLAAMPRTSACSAWPGDAIGGPCSTTSCLSGRSKTRGRARGSWHKAKMAMAMQRKTTTITSRTSRAGTSMPWGALCGLGKGAQPVIHQIIGCSERVIQDVSARLPQHFTPQRGRHGVPGPAGRSCPAPGDALHIMTSRLAIHRCQEFHWRPRPVLHLSLTRR